MIQPALNIGSSDSRNCSSKFTILKVEEIDRPAGYVLPGYDALAITVSRNGLEATGYGEGDSLLAKEKALSEAIERSALREFVRSRGISETSNGWSCHHTEPLAIENAILELIERDVVLSAWQTGGPFFEMPEALWPSALKVWKAAQRPRPEFFDLRLFLSETRNGASISALLFNERGNFVAGHASGLKLKNAIISATAECFRAAHAAIRFEHFAEVLSLHAATNKMQVEPGAHSLAYAYTVEIPSQVRIVSASESEILKKWDQHLELFQELDLRDYQVTLFHVEGRVVARVKNEKYKQIFWGQDPSGSKFQNNSPHFVG